MQKRHFAYSSLILLFFSLFSLSACGTLDGTNISGTDDDEGSIDLSDLKPLELPSPTQGFWTERLGIGPDWYDYIFKGHQIIPRNDIYAVTDGDDPGKTIYIQVVIYYNDSGDSGFLTLKVAKGTGTPKEISTTTSVKENPLCLSFDKLDFVSCNDPYDVVITANRRPVVEFVIDPPNPTFSIVPKQDRHIYAIPAKDFSQVRRADNAWKNGSGAQKAVEMKSAYQNHADSRLASATEGFVQITVHPYDKGTNSGEGSLSWKAIAWRLDSQSNKIEYQCYIPVGGRTGDEYLKKPGPFNGVKKRELSVATLQNDKIYRLILCGGYDKELNESGGDIIEEVTLPHGLWRITTKLPVTLEGITAFFALDTIYLAVDSNGTKRFFLTPNGLAWAYGKKHNIKSLDASEMDNMTFKEGVVPFGDIPEQ